MIRTVLYCLKKQNIVNDVVPLYRNEKIPLKGISFDNLVFDAVAYSSLPALAYDDTNKRPENTIVLFDIAIERVYSMGNLQGFYNRIQSVKNSVKRQRRSVMPIIIALQIEKEVINRCKKMGIIVYQLEHLFGSRIQEVLRRFAHIHNTDFSQEQEDGMGAIEKVLEIIRDSGQDTNLENLRGCLFEYFMQAVIYKWLKGNLAGSLITGKKLVFDEENGHSYEYDIIAPSEEEYLVIELKGLANSQFIKWGEKTSLGKYEKNTLGWFFREMLPVAQKHYKNNVDQKQVKACFITTAHFDAEAKPILERLNNSSLKSRYMNISYDGNSLIAKLRELKMDREVHVLKQFYYDR